MGRSALVVGGGIGGLAAGRALSELGFAVQILERSPNLDPIGAGISLWPNAVRVLRDLGVADAFPKSVELEVGSGLHRWDGRVLAGTDPVKIEQRFGAPMLLLQRATLHAALLAGGVESLVRTGAEVVRVKQTAELAQVELGTGETLEADVLIGADGINSRVRAELLGDGPPRPSGLLGYRAIVEMPPSGLESGEYWGPGLVFGQVPVDGNRIYWFATRRTAGNEPPEPDPRLRLLDRYRGWATGIAEIIEATPAEKVLKHYLLDRKPTRRWTTGRVALLGDAAHPMLPFLGQGACQALEDARVLAEALHASTDTAEALHSYQERRRRPAARIVVGSRRMGRIAFMRTAPLRALRDRAMAMTPERIRMRALDSIVGRV